MKDYSKKIITIPNLLSMLRFVLAFLFLALYLNAKNLHEVLTAFGVLVLSAFTDIIDGKIARHFHMVSNLGKILDPVADKVTQGAVMLALLGRYPFILLEIAIFTIKECYMVVNGLKVMKKTGWQEGALWYGKLNTVVLYASSILLVLWYEMPQAAANAVIGIGCVSIVFCFFMYHREFKRLLRKYELRKSAISRV